jgi:DNA-binding transcriptional LysR family regulator
MSQSFDRKFSFDKFSQQKSLLVSVLSLCCSSKMNNGFRNWSDVRVFLAVCRCGSTLAASKMLGLAQPTVARRIEALEHELGVVLFERDTRGFKPTKDAMALLPLAEAIESATGEFANAANRFTATQPIRITYFAANLSHQVMAILGDFTELHPEIGFEFLSSIRVLDLKAGEADVALRISRKRPDPDLICRKISTAQFTIFGSKTYAEKHGLPASRDDLAGHEFAVYKRDDVPDTHHSWLVKHVPSSQIIKTFHEIDLAQAAVVSGRALGIINLRLAKTFPDLIPCFDPLEELSAEHMILISPEAYRRQEVKTFIKFFAPRYAAFYR